MKLGGLKTEFLDDFELGAAVKHEYRNIRTFCKAIANIKEIFVNHLQHTIKE